MGAKWRQCAELIDAVDLLIASSRTKTGSNGKRLVLSRDRKSGPKSALFIEKKSQLLEAMIDTFIETRTKSLRMSALLTFCHESGLELVTQECRPYQRASFTVRTAGFDLVVKSEAI